MVSGVLRVLRRSCETGTMPACDISQMIKLPCGYTNLSGTCSALVLLPTLVSKNQLSRCWARIYQEHSILSGSTYTPIRRHWYSRLIARHARTRQCRSTANVCPALPLSRTNPPLYVLKSNRRNSSPLDKDYRGVSQLPYEKPGVHSNFMNAI
jgi:hypothetical protein